MIAAVVVSLVFVVFVAVRWLVVRRRRQKFGNDTVVVGFFHPYCNAGGGGERVLWAAIRALQTAATSSSKIRCVVYTGDIEATPQEIIARTKDRFNIVLPDPVDFVFLHQRHWIEDKRYPYFTLLGQSLGSIILAFEAFWHLVPDIYFDSMGYAFTYPVFKLLGGCTVICYVHYPTISSDMLQRVQQRSATYNNISTISRSPILTQAKLIYYRLFAWLYGWVGSCSDLIMVNSSWTRNHILEIWQRPTRTFVVYPPCNTEGLQSLSLFGRKPWIVSVAQFRPEKNHRLQLESFQRLLLNKPELRKETRLLLIGSSRNQEDEQRIADLKSLAKALEIENNVDFNINVSFDELRAALSSCIVGLHTMWNEHFGIGIVEYMAAGLVAVAHRSGGPLADIIVPQNQKPVGFLAETAEEFAETMERVLLMKEDQRLSIQSNARAAAASRFADKHFADELLRCLKTTSLRRYLA